MRSWTNVKLLMIPVKWVVHNRFKIISNSEICYSISAYTIAKICRSLTNSLVVTSTKYCNKELFWKGVNEYLKNFTIILHSQFNYHTLPVTPFHACPKVAVWTLVRQVGVCYLIYRYKNSISENLMKNEYKNMCHGLLLKKYIF